MSSQVISYRLSTDEVLALRQKASPGESDNQTAQRLMREVLGLSTEVSTQSTLTLDERIESIVEDRLSSFAANQNDLLSRLQERLQERLQKLEAQIANLSLADNRSSSPLPVDKVDESVDDADNERDHLPVDTSVDIVDEQHSHPSPTLVDKTVDIVDESLTQAELSKRLGVDPATLSKNRTKANFPEWSQGKDPKGMAWRYLPKEKRYTPILSTPSTDVDMEESLVGDRWKSRVDEVVASL